MIVYVSGAAGSGKNTLIKQVVAGNEKVKYLISYTTRAMRKGEIQGNPYNFVSKEELKKMFDKGELIEFQEVHGDYYGNSKKDLLEHGNKDYALIKDQDVYGVANVKKALENEIKFVTVFLDVPKKILYKRLKARGESEEVANRRMRRFDEEVAHKDKYDFVFRYLSERDGVYALESVIKNSEEFYFSKPRKKLNRNKIEESKRLIMTGEKLPIIKMAVYGNNKLVALTRNELLAASIELGINVPKTIIKVNRSKKAKFK